MSSGLVCRWWLGGIMLPSTCGIRHMANFSSKALALLPFYFLSSHFPIYRKPNRWNKGERGLCGQREDEKMGTF